LDLRIALIAVAGLSSLLAEKAAGAAFARGFRTSHEANKGLARCETGLLANRLTGRYAATLALPLCESFATTTAGAGAAA
jgi:hypothetical protein